MLVKNQLEEKDIFHVFQTILDLSNNSPLGYEALIRSVSIPSPEFIFHEASDFGKLYEIDCYSIEKAIKTYQSNGYTSEDGKLFLNILPSTILHEYFMEFIMNLLKRDDLSKQEIILEISESENIEDFDAFINKISELKKLGFKIAIDDFGRGYSDIKSIIELEPHYIKFDRYFSKELATCSKKRELIKSIISYCEKYECELILEGIERKVDLETAYKLGVTYVQGYLFGKPSSLKSKSVVIS
ncbi:EAL domain-containing protein [Bacillus sp. JJ1562]|uniref:EAL domain-containing protein n=1 Tax=Bacillus sp. JJ1562 TaxID=3122960 RepID=UPI0030012409